MNIHNCYMDIIYINFMDIVMFVDHGQIFVNCTTPPDVYIALVKFIL